MATSLDDLRTLQSSTQIFQTLLGVYQANGFPVQSWQTGGVERTRLMAFATALADVSGNYIAEASAGGFLDFASTNWLRLTAEELYEVIYNKASFTQGTITLTAASGVPTSTYQAGQLIAVFSDTGHRYLNTGTVVIPAGPGSVSGTFQAEFAGSSYSDQPNGILTLVTAIPGVTLTNPAGAFTTPVAHVGSGTGTVTPGGSPTTPHQVIVRIDSTGTASTASWSYSLDGSPFVSFGTGNATNLAGTSINITLANGASGTSFVKDDTYAFTNPGSWITVQGSDDESDTALAERCRNRWSTLSPIPTNSFYKLIATSTPSVGSQVTQVVVINDSVVNNQVNIVVAGPGGVLPPATVASIQSYINPRVPITDKPVVVSPTTTSVTLAATVTATASQLTAAQSAIQTSMTNYINSVGINGVIRLAAIIELIMEVDGVIDVSGLTINSSSANVTLGSSTTFVLPSPLTVNFTYVTQ